MGIYLIESMIPGVFSSFKIRHGYNNACPVLPKPWRKSQRKIPGKELLWKIKLKYIPDKGKVRSRKSRKFCRP